MEGLTFLHSSNPCNMEQFFGDSVRVTCPPRKSLKFINLLLMFLVATMRPSCTYSNTMVGTAATSSASSSAASAHKKVSGNQNTENIDKLVDDHLSSAEARALYEKANLLQLRVRGGRAERAACRSLVS